MKSGVYIIIHRQTGWMYIGSSCDIEKRWRHHKSKHNRQLIGRAIKKHGPDAFDWLIAEEVDPDRLLEREQHYLDEQRPFVSERRGYNISPIAGSNRGCRWSDQQKARASETHRGVPKSPEHVEKMRAAGKVRDISHLDRYRGRPNSAETRRKISESRKGQTWRHDKERMERFIAARIGKKHSPERVEKIRQSHIGSKRSDEAKANMSAWQQRTYEAVAPDGTTHTLQSRDLKPFTKERGLTYENFCNAANTGKPYKGWQVRRLNGGDS